MNIIQTDKGNFVYCNVRVPLDLRLKATEHEINLSRTLRDALSIVVENCEKMKDTKNATN